MSGPIKSIEDCVKNKKSSRRFILVRVPRSLHDKLLDKAKGAGVSIEQYCEEILSLPPKKLVEVDHPGTVNEPTE